MLLIGATALATLVAAQSTPPPATITRAVIATTKLVNCHSGPTLFQSGERYPSTGGKDRLIGVQWHPLPSIGID